MTTIDDTSVKTYLFGDDTSPSSNIDIDNSDNENGHDIELSGNHDVIPISIITKDTNNHSTCVITNSTKDIESRYDTIHRDYFIDLVTQRMHKNEKTKTQLDGVN